MSRAGRCAATCDECGGVVCAGGEYRGEPINAAGHTPGARFWHWDCEERESARREEQMRLNDEIARAYQPARVNA